jgi:hypothetical protein
MTRPRTSSIPVVVDVDGVEVRAVIRRQRRKGGIYNVRWRIHGAVHEKSTGTDVVEEAKRNARMIIRGEAPSPTARPQGRLTIHEFEQIVRTHHLNNARAEAGISTFKEFLGIWESFLRVCPIKTVHEVTEQVAVRYLERLKGMSKTQNRSCKKKSTKKLSIKTIQKHIRTLAGAWNLVREGHGARVGGLHPHQLVQTNPWEAIRRNIPQDPKDLGDEDPVQFELVNNDLGQFLDQFKDRRVGELFVITSLWCWGRITEMTQMEWSWIEGDYVVIPNMRAKKGRGKIARLPPEILERLENVRVADSPYVFAGWTDDMKHHSRRPGRVEPFTPRRMLDQMQEFVAAAADKIGRPEISHHALRRTAMELGEEAELRHAEATSAEKLQTTVGNKRRNYTKRLGKKAYTLADGMYSNLTAALHDFPALAKRLGCEPLATLAEREAEKLFEKLTPLQRQRLAKKLQQSEDDQGVA